MSTTLQFRRGTTTELGTQTGALAELFVDTTKNTVAVMDGTTLGGTPLAKASEIPTAISDLTNDAGYVTLNDIPPLPNTVSDLTNDAGYITTADVSAAGLSGSYNDLLNIPTNLLKTTDIGTSVQAYNPNLAGWAASTPPTGDIVGTTDFQILENKTLTNYAEEVYALPTSGTIALQPTNGSIQTCALSGLTTFDFTAFSSGQSVLLMLTDANQFTITWPTMTWVTVAGNTAPTLTAADAVIIWKIGTTIYGALVGSYA